MKNERFSSNLSKKDLAYILGALRDGCFTVNRKHYIYRIRVYQKNKEWIERVSEIFERCFDKKPTIVQDKRDSVWCLLLNSKEIYERLAEIANFPGNQKEWSTPPFILESDSEIQKAYLKGFFDSEGGINRFERKSFDPKNIRIYFCQANRKSLEDLREIIIKLGMRTGKVTGPYFKKGFENPVHGLRIHGINEVGKFAKIVGSMHPEKIERFRLLNSLANSHRTP